MKKSILAVASALLLASSVPAAVEVSTAYTSDYYFRGVQLADSIIEAAVDYSNDSGFYAGIWTAQPLEGQTLKELGFSEEFLEETDYETSSEVPSYANEVDFYAGYGFDVAEGVSLDVGACMYYYPDTGGNHTTEAYVGAAFDVSLAPSVYVYYDFDLEVFTFEGSIGHSIELDEASSIDLGVSAGYVSPDKGDSGIYYVASIGYGYALSETASFSASVNYTDGDDEVTGMWDDGVWFSLGIAVGF